MKICSTCSQQKHLSQFYPHPHGAFGRRAECKQCSKAASVAWARANPEKHAAWGRANPEKHAASFARWDATHPGESAARAAEWAKLNAAQVNARHSKRRAAQLQATPKWANDFFIEEAYHLAQLRTKVTGFKWHADHVVPLKHPLVQGLHVEFNLRVIPWYENITKGNRHWPDMP